MYNKILVKELNNRPTFKSGNYFFEIVIDDIFYEFEIVKTRSTGINFLFTHKETRCHACKEKVKKGSSCYNLFTMELFQNIIEHMFSSTTLRIRLLTMYQELYKDLKKELSNLHEFKEE